MTIPAGQADVTSQENLAESEEGSEDEDDLNVAKMEELFELSDDDEKEVDKEEIMEVEELLQSSFSKLSSRKPKQGFKLRLNGRNPEDSTNSISGRKVAEKKVELQSGEAKEMRGGSEKRSMIDDKSEENSGKQKETHEKKTEDVLGMLLDDESREPAEKVSSKKPKQAFKLRLNGRRDKSEDCLVAGVGGKEGEANGEKVDHKKDASEIDEDESGDKGAEQRKETLLQRPEGVLGTFFDEESKEPDDSEVKSVEALLQNSFSKLAAVTKKKKSKQLSDSQARWTPFEFGGLFFL